ncbi:uncharacterized protein J7T54_001490 [Emericellopsis cladophorae]|uniref:Uncharacterized protein n=1 Tax=Emericellopsis cladophorae TaxID=2686198 RepID=A0A9P9Y112_9HYPO|nr:uncharacterized protein J7T54_001490 [Emericellopsis cladophorae]KAI6781527.1 hypothetical protein J7T54_001490 [Emericellopsis cladophorae]
MHQSSSCLRHFGFKVQAWAPARRMDAEQSTTTTCCHRHLYHHGLRSQWHYPRSISSSSACRFANIISILKFTSRH